MQALANNSGTRPVIKPGLKKTFSGDTSNVLSDEMIIRSIGKCNLF